MFVHFRHILREEREKSLVLVNKLYYFFVKAWKAPVVFYILIVFLPVPRPLLENGIYGIGTVRANRNYMPWMGSKSTTTLTYREVMMERLPDDGPFWKYESQLFVCQSSHSNNSSSSWSKSRERYWQTMFIICS